MIKIEVISPDDNLAIESVIRNVFIEHGIDRPGTAFFDPSLKDMFHVYTGERTKYFIAKKNGKVIGGSGIYPTEGLPEDTCELVKMYLLKEYRGLGVGKALIGKCMDAANEFGYKNIYLETTPELNAAIKMYEKSGFHSIENRMGNSGHHSCGIFMLKKLS